MGFIHKFQKSNTINIDSNGIRKSLNSSESPEIIFLGGSTMFGLGSNDENTIPSLVSEMSNRKFSVINLGTVAYNSFQSYLRLTQEKIDLSETKYIISYDGVNEIFNNIKSSDKRYRHSYTEQFNNFFNLMKENKEDSDLSLIEFSKDIFFRPLFKFIFLSMRKMSLIQYKNWDESYDFDSNSINQSSIKLLQSWSLIKKNFKNDKIKFIFILQPISYVGKPNIDHLNDDPIRRKFYSEFYINLKNNLMNNYDFKDLRENFFDFSSILDGNEKYYYDFCHLTPKGNKVVSNEILKIIE